MFHRLEQLPDDDTIGWDLHFHPSIEIEVDYRECLAGSVKDILGDVEGSLVTFGAEATAFTMSVVWVYAGGAVRGVTCKCFHNIELVVVG